MALKLKLPAEADCCNSAGDSLEFPPRDERYSRCATYFPRVDDVVIGVVVARQNDGYLLDINAHRKAFLRGTAFVGATLNHHPTISTGSVLLCGVTSNVGFDLVNLSCKAGGDKKPWDTKESYLGLLQNGIIESVGIANCVALLSPSCVLLHLIAAKFDFEICIGLNGFIYVTSDALTLSNFIALLIKQCLSCTNYKNVRALIDARVKEFSVTAGN